MNNLKLELSKVYNSKDEEVPKSENYLGNKFEINVDNGNIRYALELFPSNSCFDFVFSPPNLSRKPIGLFGLNKVFKRGEEVDISYIKGHESEYAHHLQLIYDKIDETSPEEQLKWAEKLAKEISQTYILTSIGTGIEEWRNRPATELRATKRLNQVGNYDNSKIIIKTTEKTREEHIPFLDELEIELMDPIIGEEKTTFQHPEFGEVFVYEDRMESIGNLYVNLIFQKLLEGAQTVEKEVSENSCLLKIRGNPRSDRFKAKFKEEFDSEKGYEAELWLQSFWNSGIVFWRDKTQNKNLPCILQEDPDTFIICDELMKDDELIKTVHEMTEKLEKDILNIPQEIHTKVSEKV